jgi:membrane protease YdiL (CAAX protease family)
MSLKSLFNLNLHFDRNVTAITIVSTLLLIIDAYHLITPLKFVDRVGLYLFIPLGIIIFAFRESPREYGFRLGDWKAGLVITALVILVAVPLLWFVARGEAMRQYYQGQNGPALLVDTSLDLIGWEFFFRGFILFGYARQFKDHALWLQAVPFAMAHIGKPEVETLSTIFGGFLFGLVAWRTRSFLYPFLIHWFITTFTILVAAGVVW